MTWNQAALLGLLGPAAVSAIFLAIGRYVGKGRPWSGAAGVGLGYAVGQVAALGLPGLPPVDATHWPLWIALLGAALGLIETFGRAPGWIRWPVRALLVGIAMLAICRPKLDGGWETDQVAAWAIGLTLATLVLGFKVEQQARRLAAPVVAVSMWAVSVALAIIFVVSHSIVQGQLAMALVSSLLPILVLSWWKLDRAVVEGAVLVFALLLPTFLALNEIYGEVPPACALLVGLSPAVWWLSAVGPIRRLSPRLAGLATLLLTCFPLGLAAWLAIRAAAAVEAANQVNW